MDVVPLRLPRCVVPILFVACDVESWADADVIAENDAITSPVFVRRARRPRRAPTNCFHFRDCVGDGGFNLQGLRIVGRWKQRQVFRAQVGAPLE